jgi:hypothetical protein
MGLWVQPICVRGIPPHVAAQMVEAAPFLVGSVHTVYDAQFFHKQLGLCYRGLLVKEIYAKECPDRLWASTWPLHEDGQPARARISGCRNAALKAEFLKLYKKVYGQKPDNGCFLQKFVRAAMLLIISKKDVNFAEFAAKLTEACIRKAKNNPWKLTLLAFREYIEAMVRVITSTIILHSKDLSIPKQRCNLRVASLHSVPDAALSKASIVVITRKRTHPGDSLETPSLLDRCQLGIDSLQVKIEELQQQAQRSHLELKAAHERVQTCEEIELQLEDQLAECRKASRECASKGDWTGKGRYDVKARSLQSTIASTGLDVSDAQATVLSSRAKHI